ADMELRRRGPSQFTVRERSTTTRPSINRGPARLPRMRLRVPPSRSIVGIDEFAVPPLRMPARISERFLQIALLLSVLHYDRTIEHIPGNHPLRAIPSQNPLQFWHPLRFHAGLMPEFVDSWSDRRDRAHEH